MRSFSGIPFVFLMNLVKPCRTRKIQGEISVNFWPLYLIFQVESCIMVLYRTRKPCERNDTVKKALLIGILLLGLIPALAACDGGTPADTRIPDTTVTETAPSTPDEATGEISEPSAETETLPEEPTVGTDGQDTAEPSDTAGDVTDIPTDTPADTPTDTPADIPSDTPAETPTEAPTEPEETGPGELVFVSNEELIYLDNMGNEVGKAFASGEYDQWTKRALTVGQEQVAVLMDMGWAAFDSRSYCFGYVVNGAEFFSDGYAREADADVRAAATRLGASNCARYCGGLTAEALQLGDNHIQFCVRLDGDVTRVLREYTVTVSRTPVRLDGSFWQVEMDLWEVSGHKKGITSASDPSHGGMVRAGGVDRGALLHQGAIGIGTVDLSKYEKIIVYYGCDASAVTQGHYNASANNRIIISRVDTDGKNAPDQKDIIASETYPLLGWTPNGLEIDLTGINYKGPVYITVDTLPGTFMLITAIELVGGEKPEGSDQPSNPDTPTPPPAQGNYAPALSDWKVTGHKKGITSASDPTHGGMVAAGGVSEGALLHQGAIGVGEVDLSKYSKVIVYYGCDASGVTQNHYNSSPNNRIMLSKVDTNGMNSPEQADIIASETYTLRGWAPYGLEIDLSGINYEGPVYISVDTLPGTFVLITAIEFVV